jgi:hypothetical protein
VNDGCPAKGAAETACTDAIDNDADTNGVTVPCQRHGGDLPASTH